MHGIGSPEKAKAMRILMNELITLLLSFLVGLFIGFFFFQGLLWTIKKGLISRRPALWFSISFLIRMGVAILGFYLISGKGMPALIFCFLGLMLMRYVIKRKCIHESKSR
jgi:F1F0 ATPase subunit 2